MKTLAIHGHTTRGKEVIKILEMFGGKNKDDLTGNSPYFYYINCNNCIDIKRELKPNLIAFYLEEFLEKYPYKVGDKVLLDNQVKVIKGIGWDSNNYEVIYTLEANINGVKTQYQVFNYDLRPYKEEPKLERNYPELRMDPSDDDKLATEVVIRDDKILPPKGYLIGKITDVDNGMLVEFVRKQSQYPKTYEECSKILHTSCSRISTPGYRECQISLFQELIICRDAYWKIIGKEMGLSEPWKPKYISLVNNEYFTIHTFNNEIIKSGTSHRNAILAFPTEEMRDAFFENFKDLIEKCKEFL